MHTALCINESFISRARVPQSFLEEILSRQNQSHDTFASWHSGVGTTVEELMLARGWKSAAAARRYIHRDEADTVRISARTEGMLYQ